MEDHDETRRRKLDVLREAIVAGEASGIARDFSMGRLMEELEKGEADLADGRAIILEDDKAVREFFARLTQGFSGCDPRR